MDALLPPEMARKAEDVGVAKATMSHAPLFVLAVLAGAFIGLGAMFFTVVTAGGGVPFGVARIIGGLAFCLGLVLVVLAGAELFTGNNLIVMAWASGRVRGARLLGNWAVVYAGNFAGALATAWLVWLSGQGKLADGDVGDRAGTLAAGKCALEFSEAFARGVLCNALVCLAVWLCYSARSVTGKILAILFPITAFVAGGFEHCVANMYFVPMGLLLDARGVTWSGFLAGNLLPVTLGNILGGAGLVGLVYWFVYVRARKPDGP